MINCDFNEMFGKEFYIELMNGERKYFGLNEINSEWDVTTLFSKTNCWYKRVTVFWNLNTIIKVILEEKRVSDESEVNYHKYTEFDTEIKTDNRENILPLTSKGKPKKLTVNNLLTVTPFGCRFTFVMDSLYEENFIIAENPRSNQVLAIGEEETISKIRSNHDFRRFVESYISSCPSDYFDRVDRMRNSKHKKTVKYRVGDIFRVEIDRFNYCYGLITGEVRKIQKWNELPQKHSLRSLMTVPIMIRFFDLITPNGNMTASDLKDVPLTRMDIYSDNDIIWGTHQIVDHKELTPEDLEFDLVCTKFTTQSKNNTVFTEDDFINMQKDSKEYNLYIEWGTAATTLSYSQISEKLREFLVNYKSPYGGVQLTVFPYLMKMSDTEREKSVSYRFDLLEEHNMDIRNELFLCIGLHENATFNDFANKFGGLTKDEILCKLI